MIASASFTDQEAEGFGSEARHEGFLVLFAQQRRHEIEDGSQVWYEQTGEVLEEPGQATKAPLNDFHIGVCGCQVRYRLDRLLEMFLKPLAQVMRKMRHETEQRLLAESLPLFYELYE